MKFNTIKSKYLASSLHLRIIYINIAVFVLIKLVAIFMFFFTGSGSSVWDWIGVPADFWLALRRPWTVITYMFSHNGVFDIFFNMLWLFWIGRIFLEYFNPKQLVGLYLLGGVAGAVLFIAAFNLLPHLSYTGTLVGASAAVLAVVIGITIYRPNYEMSFFFIGGIPLKWIAIATVVIYLISFDGTNVGGGVAHIGGMLIGLWFGLSIKRGHDITAWLNRGIDSLVALFQSKKFSKKPKSEKQHKFKYKKSSGKNNNSANTPPAHDSDAAQDVTEEQLDNVLDKLKRSGYGALSDEEKDILFNASRKRDG